MRTRRSPRNQERLWRELGRQGEQPKPKPPQNIEEHLIARAKANRPHRRPSRRQIVLAMLRIAGYHNDSKTWTRVYIENRVSIQIAQEQFTLGARLKAAGIPCSCFECAKPPKEH